MLGGGRLRQLLDRLEPIRSFGAFLSEKERNEEGGWKIAEGFIVGNEEEIDTLVKLKKKAPGLTDEENLKLQELEKKFQTAEYLTGKNTLPTDAFTEDGIDDSKIDKLENKYFIRNREKNKEIFQAPHLLIKEGVSENSIPVIFREDDLSFRHEIIGIHAPNQAEALKKIENRFRNNRTYLFHVAGFSSRYMITRATAILKHDIECLPFPEDENELELSDLERILMDDVLDYMLDFRRKGESADSEKPVTQGQLKQFSNVYCRVLNSVYQNLRPHHYFETRSYICFPFYFDDPSSIVLQKTERLEDDLDELIKNNVHSNARIIRMLRIYENNIIYLIKPKQTRYWLRSVAIRDADETFSDLVTQGF
nr:hypothetical protein [Desulfobacula sp.]